ncbi:hypothetical protein G6011_04706 [Alternaria panax]|uniref:Uncharacterized protein n=1 Tax=Alternaria panax TaxID=48097 RepID=A0AAD4IHU3_9PLEO|nr:hypothetical protein G6011_04706 [Alternaria panax]
MTPPGLEFQDIHTWATQDFPADFQHLPDAKAFSVQFNIVRGFNHDSRFKSLVIGRTYTTRNEPVAILAWLAGTRIQIGYTWKNGKGEPQIQPIIFAEENVSWRNFKFPFNVIHPTQEQTEVACFNAMVRYYFLAKGWSKGVIDESDVFNRFVARFPHACRTVASAVQQKPGLDRKVRDAVYVPYISRGSGGLVGYQRKSGVGDGLSRSNRHLTVALHEQRTPYLFEQIANDPVPRRSYTVLSSPSPSPPPFEDRTIIQDVHPPLEMHADASVQRLLGIRSRSGDPQQVSPGGDQTSAFDGLDTGERDESGLRKKVFDLNIRLMIAEGLARDAETLVRKFQQEAQLWKERYEGAESYKTRYEEIRNRFGLQE